MANAGSKRPVVQFSMIAKDWWNCELALDETMHGERRTASFRGRGLSANISGRCNKAIYGQKPEFDGTGVIIG